MEAPATSVAGGQGQRRGRHETVLILAPDPDQPLREASYPGLFYIHTFTLYRRGRSLPVPAKEPHRCFYSPE